MSEYKHIGRVFFGDKAIITDSCYDLKTWCNFIANIRAGEYDCYAKIKNINNWGERVWEIVSIRRDATIISDNFDELEWLFEFGEIGVDSGSCGVFDLEFFNDNNDKELDSLKSGKISDEENEKFYDRMCGLTDNDNHCGTYKHGFNSSSGLGDGGYELYVLKDDEGFITAMKVVFISEEDLECDDE
jgi:hypothetical protein